MAPSSTSWGRNLQFGLAQLQLLSLSSAFFFAASVSPRLVNITVDDTFGDPTTGVLPEYSTNGHAWNAGSSTENVTCGGCNIYPALLNLSQIFDGTWHDTTPTPSDPPTTATVQFIGSAVYVFNVLPNTLPGTITLANISFSIDGEDVGAFVRSPASGTAILYNQLVYQNTTLKHGPHTLAMSPSSGSLILFDYLLYTTQANDTTSSSASDGSSQSSSSSRPTSATSPNGSALSSPSRTPVGVIVGAVLGGVALLLGAAMGVYVLCRRRRRPRTAPFPVPSSLIPANGGHDVYDELERVEGVDASPSRRAPSTVSRATAISSLRLLDGAPTRVQSEAPGPESTHTSLRVAAPSMADRSSKHRAELVRRLEALQRTRSVLSSSQTTARRTRSELGSESGTEVAIRDLEAEMAQLRGVLSALNVRLADGGHESLPAYAE